MKKFVYSIATLIVVMGMLPSAAQATTLLFDDYVNTGLFNTGQFHVILRDDSGNPVNGGTWFTAFCVELDQYIAVGDTLSTTVSPEGFQNDIGLQAAWLFDTYYRNDASNVELAALQLALWNITDNYVETGYDPYGVIDKANSYIASLNANFDSADLDYLNQAYTIFTDPDKQDLIVKTGAAVPEPAVMLLLATGLLGVIGFSRRKVSK